MNHDIMIVNFSERTYYSSLLTTNVEITKVPTSSKTVLSMLSSLSERKYLYNNKLTDKIKGTPRMRFLKVS